MIPFRAIVLATLLAAAPASTVGSWLQLPGIPGESTDDKHKNWIAIESMSFGPTNTTGTSSGGGAGKVSIHDLHITKATDKSSPLLMQAAATGKPFATAEIDVGSTRYILKQVLVSSVQQGGHGGGTGPTESVTLNYESMQIIYPSKTGATPGATMGAASTARTTATMPVGGVHPATAPATTMRAASAATAPASMAAPPSAAATLASQLTPSLSAAAKHWVGTEGGALSQFTGTTDQFVTNAHRAALSRFNGIQPNVAGALSFLALMDAAKTNHSAALQSAITQVMGTTNAAAAGGLVNLK
jgi:type VI secretion system secreted protein Hcp